MRGLYHTPHSASYSLCGVQMKIMKVLLVLPLALPVTIFLVHWPVVFAVVGVSLCSGAFAAMVVHIVVSAPPFPPPPSMNRQPMATVDGRPVWDVEVLP